jgi:hypothetical protein
MDLSGVFSIVALVAGVLLLIPLVVGGVFVVVVVANRAEPDPSGRRPALVYSLGVAFLTLFATLFATTAFVAALCRLFGSHPSTVDAAPSFSGSSAFQSTLFVRHDHLHPLGDAVARAAVLSALIALVAGVVCGLHLRAAARGSADAARTDQLGRVLSSYVAAVSFFSVIIIVFATVVALYAFCQGVAPGVFTQSGRADGENALRSLIPAFYLAVATGVILLAHLRYAPPPFRPAAFGRLFGGPPPERSRVTPEAEG